MVDEHIERLIAELRPKCAALGESPWLEEAVRAVPRHLFIERFAVAFNANDPWGPAAWATVDRTNPSPQALQAIYSDRGLMMKPPPEHSAASQPALVLMMLHELGLEPGMKVLEIGTGSGWNAALTAHGVGGDGLVHSVDIQHDLVERAREHLTAAGHPGVNLRAADGGAGWPEAAPFDRIVATVGCPDIPPAWLDQLTDGGVLLVPLLMRGFGAHQKRNEERPSGLHRQVPWAVGLHDPPGSPSHGRPRPDHHRRHARRTSRHIRFAARAHQGRLPLVPVRDQ